MTLFYQLCRLKDCNNYVSRVRIDFEAYTDILGQIVIPRYSTFVILEHVEDTI